jgi:hypothetical protein
MLESRLSPIAFCLALSVCVLGCQHFDRARECRSVSRLVNPVLAGIDAERQKAPDSAVTYRLIGTQYDRLAAALTGQRPQNRHVQEAVTDYQKMLREAAHDARLFADALDTKDATRIAATHLAASRTMKHESTAVSHWDGVCKGH